jgi:hypothetical protein
VYGFVCHRTDAQRETGAIVSRSLIRVPVHFSASRGVSPTFTKDLESQRGPFILKKEGSLFQPRDGLLRAVHTTDASDNSKSCHKRRSTRVGSQ